MAKKTAAEVIAEGPKRAADEDEAKPLGVPKDYTTRDTNSFGFTETIRPAFMEGDDYKPARLTPENIARLQRQLVGAGVLTSKFRIGVWDDVSRKAYRKVLQFANQNGINDDARALERLGMTQVYDPDDAPLPPNPLDLRAASRSAGTAGLGRALTDTERSSFESGLSAQMTQENAPGSAGQQEWAEQKVRSFDPLKFDARSALSAFDTVADMFRGGELAVPE